MINKPHRDSVKSVICHPNAALIQKGLIDLMCTTKMKKPTQQGISLM